MLCPFFILLIIEFRIRLKKARKVLVTLHDNVQHTYFKVKVIFGPRGLDQTLPERVFGKFEKRTGDRSFGPVGNWAFGSCQLNIPYCSSWEV